MTELIYKFITLTVEEIRAFMTGNYKESIDIFDTLLTHTDAIGEYFTEGLYNYITNSNSVPQPTQPKPAPPAIK